MPWNSTSSEKKNTCFGKAVHQKCYKNVKKYYTLRSVVASHSPLEKG